MSSFSRQCGCKGGDGGCSYSGSWFDPCADYPHCGYGVAEAKAIVANDKWASAEKKKEDKLKTARAVALAKLTAKERRLLGLTEKF